MSKITVRCKVEGVRSIFKPKLISFNTGTDLNMRLEGCIGMNGLSPIAADLVDLAATVYQIDRHITSWWAANYPARIQLRMQLRRPNAWSDRAIKALQAALQILGNTPWDIDFESGLRAAIPKHHKESARKISQVVLFSGGADSTCGAITLRPEAKESQLVSFYTVQKNLQRMLASALGFVAPNQWRMQWAKEPGPGRSFYFRSFLFLALAGVVAESWNARTILQFENGILATGIPPTPYWMMTKHAHPRLHLAIAELFSVLFDGSWKIVNPFLTWTKRECVKHAASAMNPEEAMRLLAQTETCWYLRSNHVPGGKKRPGMPCGICVPCVLRRTAIPNERYQYDLLKDSIKKDKKYGAAFRAYYAFLRKVQHSGNVAAKFYSLLPAAGRNLADESGCLKLDDLHKLFRNFAFEFMETFRIS